jgi:F-type H+-transporting ATPase subunit alpha
MDDLPMGKIQAFEKALHQHFHSNYGDLMSKMAVSGDWNNDIEATFKKGIAEFKKTGSW